MNWLRQLIPPFVSKLDHYLLTNQPWLWSQKIHLHLWFLAVINGLLGAFALVFPIDKVKIIDVELVYGLLIIPQIIYFFFWFYKHALFNVNKQFGKVFFFQPVLEYSLRYISLMLILSIGYVPCSILNYRISKLVTDEEMIADYNALKLAKPYHGSNYSYAHYRSLEEYRNRTDNRYFSQNKIWKLKNELDGYIDDYNHYTQDTHLHADTISILLDRIDSIYCNNQLYYTSFSTGSYYDGYYRENYSDYDLQILSDSICEERYISSFKYSDNQHLEVISTYLETKKKYGEVIHIDPKVYLAFFKKIHSKIPPREIQNRFVKSQYNYFNNYFETPDEDLRNTTFLGGDNQVSAMYNLNRIEKSKSMNMDFYLKEVIIGLALFLFGLTLIVQTFKYIHWKTYLVGLVAIGLLALFTTIISAYLIYMYEVRFDNSVKENIVFFYIYLAYTALFSCLLIWKRKRSEFNWVAAVSNLGLKLLLPCLFLVINGVADKQFDVYDKYEFDRKMDVQRNRFESNEISLKQWNLENERLNELDRERREYIDTIYLSLFVFGLLFFIVLFLPILNQMDRKLYALPKKS